MTDTALSCLVTSYDAGNTTSYPENSTIISPFVICVVQRSIDKKISMLGRVDAKLLTPSHNIPSLH